MRKRLLAILATMAMVVAMVPSMVFASTAWDGTIDTSWYDSSKTDFELSNAKQLAGLAALVNSGTSFQGKTVKLTDDINLNNKDWTPIGNTGYNSSYAPVDADKAFSGVFDGNGKTISNLKIEKTIGGGADAEANVGLFSMTGEDAVIKNLTITNVTINTDGRNVGALAGFAYGAEISNITVNGKINISGGNNVSGVFAMTRYHDASAINITVSGAEGSVISGNNIVGGITAEIAPNGSNQTFKNLSVENVAINGASGVAGIVGLLTNGSISKVSVKNVKLTGRTDYSGDSKGRIRMGSVVGILGGKGPSTVSEVTVKNVTAKNLDNETITLPTVGSNYDGAIGNATEAKIGDSYYATVQIAVKAAKAGDTIEVLAVPLTELTDVPNDVKIINKTGQTIKVNEEEVAPYVEPVAPTPEKPEKSPATGDNNVAPFAVAGLVMAAMAAVVATRRRTN